MTTLWTCTPPGRFLIREWDGESVIFDLFSNDTHACDRLATALIRELSDGPSTAARISQVLTAVADWGDHANFAATTRATLEDLERLGVIERVEP